MFALKKRGSQSVTRDKWSKLSPVYRKVDMLWFGGRFIEHLSYGMNFLPALLEGRGCMLHGALFSARLYCNEKERYLLIHGPLHEAHTLASRLVLYCSPFYGLFMALSFLWKLSWHFSTYVPMLYSVPGCQVFLGTVLLLFFISVRLQCFNGIPQKCTTLCRFIGKTQISCGEALGTRVA